MFTSKHLELLLHYQDNHIARVAQLSATKQKTFFDLESVGLMEENFIEDPVVCHGNLDVKYIRITQKGHNILKHIIDSANDYLQAV